MIIDATDLLIGRLASFAAKQALLGEDIIVVNSEKAVVSGNRKDVFANYHEKHNRGNPHTGPFFPIREDLILRRTIRGMLPWQRSRGREALKRVKCHIGIPAELIGKKLDVVENAKVSKLPNFNYVKLGEISSQLR